MIFKFAGRVGFFVKSLSNFPGSKTFVSKKEFLRKCRIFSSCKIKVACFLRELLSQSETDRKGDPVSPKNDYLARSLISI